MSKAPCHAAEFAAVQQAIARLNGSLQAAKSPVELRAKLLADTAAPYHSFRLFTLMSNIELLTGEINELMCLDLDEEGCAHD
jgi:hypothetical protein